MSNDRASRPRRFTSIAALFVWLNCALFAAAQPQGWHAPPHHMLPLVGDEPSSEEPAAEPPAAAPPKNPSPPAPQHGPLARLIANPDQTDGAPPFALTDQQGTVQRYVEPVPGVDLESHVGQLVTVRNDTGLTLLASQLDLPRKPLHPMVSESDPGTNLASRALSFQPRQNITIDAHVKPTQYIDNDDMSVELLPDNMALPNAQYGGSGNMGEIPLLGQGRCACPYPMMSGETCGPCCGPQCCGPSCCGPPCCDSQCCDPQCCNPQCCDLMQAGPGMMQPNEERMIGPCPQCGGYHNSPDCNCPQSCCGSDEENRGLQLSGDIEFMFYRVHMAEPAFNKLSESFQFTPRFILNLRNVGNLDGRIRYWLYDQETDRLSGGSIRLQFDVLDIEAVHRFEGRRSQIALAAGLRFADIKLTNFSGQECSSNMLGLTMAADGFTPFSCVPGGHCGWVYGGRVSLLGGDWDGNGFIGQPFYDDNLLVTELYAGVEVARQCRSISLRGRALFEMQNWRSDVLAQQAGIESISFLGPALQIGVDF